jgi:NADH:ubiquinone oxidoreductase subunit 4 (subunit M)
MFPFHVRLPEAHVEAPTVGSVLLAGILLKLGTYGMLRFLLPLFPYANNYFTPFVYLLSVIAIIYISCTALRQIDLKKIIAYASIAHMNYVVLGMFSLNINSYVGSIFLMLSHGLVSSALLFCIGMLYDRYKTRILKYYSGLVHFMPLFSFFFLMFTLANMSFPGSSNFIGEFLILLNLITDNLYVCLLVTFSIIFGAIYSI